MQLRHMLSHTAAGLQPGIAPLECSKQGADAFVSGVKPGVKPHLRVIHLLQSSNEPLLGEAVNWYWLRAHLPCIASLSPAAHTLEPLCI